MDGLIKFCVEKRLLLERELLNLLKKTTDEETAKKIIEKIRGSSKERFITKSSFYENIHEIQGILPELEEDKKKKVEKLFINLGLKIEITKQVESRGEIKEKPVSTLPQKQGPLKILSPNFFETKKIEVKDFVNHFRHRFEEIRKILQNRSELQNLTSIDKINGQKQGISIICIVRDKRITKNKNILLEVEDLTGKVVALVNKNKEEIYDKAQNILLDDIIGIKASGNKEILFVNDIVYPDSFLQEKRKLSSDVSVAFTSDIHVGSNNFLEENFLKFINWINGEVGDEKQRQEAKKIKYLLITGDNVDGVGVFPGQEPLLKIKDIKKQYEKLAELLKKIRKDVKIIMCPGQHDAVRIAEPQPPIGEDYGRALYELDNLVLVSNPSLIEITEGEAVGVRVLMYHGASMNPIVNELDSLRMGKAHHYPTKVVKELLKRRHLAPFHSAVTYLPIGTEDPLLIKEVPDIINTADFHKPDIETYNNILIICSSCWQSITPFEEKVGNEPEPCKVPVLNLKTRELKILDFS